MMCLRIGILFLFMSLPAITLIRSESDGLDVFPKRKLLNLAPQPNPLYFVGDPKERSAESTSNSMSLRIWIYVIGGSILGLCGLTQLCNKFSISITFCNGWFTTNHNVPGEARHGEHEDHRMNSDNSIELVVHPMIQMLDGNAPVDLPPVEAPVIRMHGETSRAGEAGPVKRRVPRMPDHEYNNNISAEPLNAKQEDHHVNSDTEILEGAFFEEGEARPHEKTL